MTSGGRIQNMGHVRGHPTTSPSCMIDALPFLKPSRQHSYLSDFSFSIHCPQQHSPWSRITTEQNQINYTNPWKTDHFMSTWAEPPLSPNIHHKKLLTQCDSETKTKGVVGKKIQRETQCVPLLGRAASLFSFSGYKTWCRLVRSLSESTAEKAFLLTKHLKQIARRWH